MILIQAYADQGDLSFLKNFICARLLNAIPLSRNGNGNSINYLSWDLSGPECEGHDLRTSSGALAPF